MNDTRQYSDAAQTGLNVASDITPSVLALARVSGIKAKDFAQAIHQSDENSLYRNEIAYALQKLYVDSAVEEAKLRKEALKQG
jgi:hypothetical protein